MIESDFSPEGGWASAKALLAGKRRFSALFCANDEMAVGALSYFQQVGLGVPQQVSVLGYDDTWSAEYSAPRADLGAYPVARGDSQRPQLPAEPLLRLHAARGTRIPGQRDVASLGRHAAQPPGREKNRGLAGIPRPRGHGYRPGGQRGRSCGKLSTNRVTLSPRHAEPRQSRLAPAAAPRFRARVSAGAARRRPTRSKARAMPMGAASRSGIASAHCPAACAMVPAAPSPAITFIAGAKISTWLHRWAWAPTAFRSPGRAFFPTAAARRTRRASISTRAWSTACSSAASNRGPRCITGTCRRRCRSAAAGTTPATVARFTEFADVVSRHLGDRVKHWITHNEPWCTAFVGHYDGTHAPGIRDWRTALQVCHHVLLSHGAAIPLLRANAPRARVGISLSLHPHASASDSEADRAATRRYDGLRNRWFLDPLHGRGYPARYPAAVRRRCARRRRERPGRHRRRRRTSSASTTTFRKRSRTQRGNGPLSVRVVDTPGAERTALGWEVSPDGLVNLLARVRRDYRPAEIYITENGSSYDDVVGPDGSIDDAERRGLPDPPSACACANQFAPACR